MDLSDEDELDFEINVDEITVDDKKSTSVRKKVPKNKRKFRPIPVRRRRKPKRNREVSSSDAEDEQPKKKKRKTKKKKKKSKTTILEAAKVVLGESKKSMSGREIADEILRRKLVETGGDTFHKTVSSQIYVNMRKLEDDSFFEKAKVGKFKKRGAVVEDSETEDEEDEDEDEDEEDSDSDESLVYKPSKPKHSATSPKRSPQSPTYEY
jgi:hypothetical protein